MDDRRAPEEKAPRKERSGNKRFLLIYAFSMLLIALFLVLMSYLTQLRNARQERDDALREHTEFSVSAMGRVENLQQETEALHAQVDALQDELEATEAARIELEQEFRATIEEGRERERELMLEIEAANARAAALEALRGIERLFDDKDYDACRAALDAFGYERLLSLLPIGEEGQDASNALNEVYEKLYN